MNRYNFVLVVDPNIVTIDSIDDVKRLTSSLRCYFRRLRKLLKEPDLQYSFVCEFEDGRLTYYGVLLSDNIFRLLLYNPFSFAIKYYSLRGLSDRFGSNRFWEF